VYTHIIPALRRQKQEEPEFEGSPGYNNEFQAIVSYIVRYCLNFFFLIPLGGTG
jgi:hypothetical protein